MRFLEGREEQQMGGLETAGVFEDSDGQGEGTEHVCSKVPSLICEKISTLAFQRIRFLSFLLCPVAVHNNQ